MLHTYHLGDDGKYSAGPPFTPEDQVKSRVFPNLVIDLQQIFPEEDIAEEELIEYMKL